MGIQVIAMINKKNNKHSKGINSLKQKFVKIDLWFINRSIDYDQVHLGNERKKKGLC